MLNEDYRLFRHKVTGKSGYYPAHFREWDQFEEIDPATDTCVDCVVKTPEPQDEEPLFLPPETYTDYEEIEDN